MSLSRRCFLALATTAIEGDSGGLYRSDDWADSWTRVNADRNLRQRAWCYSRVYADPQDENTVYASNVNFSRSRDTKSETEHPGFERTELERERAPRRDHDDADR